MTTARAVNSAMREPSGTKGVCGRADTPAFYNERSSRPPVSR